MVTDSKQTRSHFSLVDTVTSLAWRKNIIATECFFSFVGQEVVARQEEERKAAEAEQRLASRRRGRRGRNTGSIRQWAVRTAAANPPNPPDRRVSAIVQIVHM
jgi:hypothetical protein